VINSPTEDVVDPTLPPNLVRFGVFELDLRARELRKSGLSTGLPEQSIKILALLIEKPGEVVLREDIRKKLWPNDTVVEFDHSINAAMQRLRQALGDPAEAPQYIETLARRGYRWKFPVELVEAQPQGAGPAEAEGVQRGTAAGGNLVGKRVSRYRVLEVLGGGGMGVVFKAEDLKLGRRVALKFLPEETANDAPTLHRFEQEARAASALNHPNICTIYGIEEHEGQPFIVMELLEGETLRELISAAKTRTTPLPLETLLHLATQITEGLAAAHQKGIIHRDIKPANVFVTTQGQAKILDFGLAKLIPVLTAAEHYPERDHPTDDVHGARGETVPVPASDLLLSRTGVAMGTAGYMSPEQVRGEKLDARTDLFSLGLVLYEMAAGQRAFTGETTPILHDAILSHTPTPVRELNPELPPKLEEIIKRALEKDREARYQTASEIRADLESLRRKLEPTLLGTRWRKMAAGVAALFVVSAIFWFANRQPPSIHAVPDLKLRQLTTNSPENRVISGAISPDGKYLAYSDLKGMHIKQIETGETRSVPQPAELEGKNVDWQVVGAWFPDGTHFLANAHAAGRDWTSLGTSIWVASVLAGPPKKLREEAEAFSISPDGSQISFGTGRGGFAEKELWLMGPDGQGARKFLEAEVNGAITALTWSPDGQRFMYIEGDAAGARGVSRDLNGGPLTTILPPSEMKQLNEINWLPDGRLIYSVPESRAVGNTCNYWARRIDLRTGARIDDPRRVTNWTGFCPSSGTATADGKRLAFLGWANHNNVYVADLEAGGSRIHNSRRLTLDESDNNPTAWTADSTAVIFFSMRNGNPGIYRQRLDQDSPELITTAPGSFSNAHVTPDGKWVVWFNQPEASGPNSAPELMRAPITGGTPELIFATPHEAALFCARAPSTLCAVGEWTEDRKEIIVTSFDPVKGRGRELLRFTVDLGSDVYCDISPDGSRIAAVTGPEKPIQIFSLRGQPTQFIPAKELNPKQFVFWAADGEGLFITHGVKGGSELVHMDLRGVTKALWKNDGGYYPWGLQSPDGHHLAIQGANSSGNMWMMENF
jgi:eukaryotic-like serine/threonine-protein kinase